MDPFLPFFIYHVSIFNKAGIVLWSRSLCKLNGNPIDDLISNVLLEEKGGDQCTTAGNYILKWAIETYSGVELIFVVVYSKLLTLLYVDDLLSKMKKAFIKEFGDVVVKPTCISCNFDAEFDRALNEAETKSMHLKKMKTNSSSNMAALAKKSPAETPSSDKIPPPNDDEAAASEEDSEMLDPKQVLEKLRSKVRRGATQPKKPNHSPAAAPSASGKSKKEDRVWAGGSGKISAKQAAALDRSKPADSAASSSDRDYEVTRATYMPDEGEKPMWELEQEEAAEFELQMEIEEDKPSGGWNFGKTYLGSMIQSITGGKILDEEDLQPVLHTLKEVLLSKNVAQEIAENICASVGKSLVGHRMASFTSIKTVVTEALRDAVQRILTPRSSTDVLRQVLDAKAQGKVFSVVFIGINGVGKSTSLAKVAYYLKQHGIDVLIAACDTFRSGAVEQLRTHSRCLDIPLFEMGYARDPSAVAAAALKHAKEKGHDCVLIDTAGRMQNNEPLMRALAKLISENSPNLSLFVGEALVGNDGIDQLSMFDKALVNYSPPGTNHHIDGIVLTKFDTIDDKVGAALSMSYKSGQPIMFVGTGQKYTHLKKLNVTTVIKHLFAA